MRRLFIFILCVAISWHAHNGLWAYLVDRDGSVHKVTVIMSTGDAGLDKRVVRYWEPSGYKTPAKLNGSPVRVLMYFKFKSIVEGK